MELVIFIPTTRVIPITDPTTEINLINTSAVAELSFIRSTSNSFISLIFYINKFTGLE